MIRNIAVLPILLWRKICSPFLGENCRYYPSCTCYAEQAILHHGVIRGGCLTVRRLLRCNSMFAGGFDPVPGVVDEEADG